jgi:CRP/FNR family nitrogen fixation transcriptional regulator
MPFNVLQLSRDNMETYREQGQLCGVSRVYGRNNLICEEGAPALYCFQVTAGAVRRFRLHADGRRQIMAIHLPGDYFALGDGARYAFDVEAIGDVELTLFERAQFIGPMNRTRSSQIVELLCRDLAAAQTHLALLGRGTVRERIAYCLEDFAARLMPDRDGSVTIELPITRLDMADYLGLTIETVSRALGDMKRKGIISVLAHQRIAIWDREGLRAMAQARPFHMAIASD